MKAQFESCHLISLLPGTVLGVPHLSSQFTLTLGDVLSILPPRKLRLQRPANLHEGTWKVGGNTESGTQTIPAAPLNYISALRKSNSLCQQPQILTAALREK